MDRIRLIVCGLATRTARRSQLPVPVIPSYNDAHRMLRIPRPRVAAAVGYFSARCTVERLSGWGMCGLAGLQYG